MPDNPEFKNPTRPEIINEFDDHEKLPLREKSAAASEHLSEAAELEKDTGVSIWIYGLALIFILFIVALILLTTVASSPTIK